MTTNVNVPGDQTLWPPTEINRMRDAVVELQGIANGGSLPALRQYEFAVKDAIHMLGGDEKAFPDVMATPPTTAFTSPGGASPITSPVSLPWQTSDITVLGAALTKVSGQNYGQNWPAGTGIPPLYSISFDSYDDDFAVKFKQRALNGAQMWLWVDGVPATAAPETLTAAASSSPAYYRATFASKAQRRIRVYIRNADLGGIDVGPTAGIAPNRAPQLRVAWHGDSWIDSATGANDVMHGIAATVERILGFELFSSGQSGSGYCALGTYSANYLDAARVAGLIAFAPDILIVSGTSNDDTGGFTGAQIQAAATSLYSQIAVGSPNTKIIVIGPPCLPPSTGSARLANRDAVKAAAAAASNVIGFIDPLDPRGVYATTADWVTNTAYKVNDLVRKNNIVQECRLDNTRVSFTQSDWHPTTWITGSGKVGATVGDGNADVMIANDGLHPSPVGYIYLGRIVAHRIEAVLRAYTASLVTG